MWDFSLGQNRGVLSAKAEGMCVSQEDAAMSWFKAPNLLLIMRSPPIQMSESFGKRRIFPCLQQYLGHSLSFLVCWLSLYLADPLLVWCADLLLALSILNPSVCMEGWRKQKKWFARETVTVVSLGMPTGSQKELKRWFYSNILVVVMLIVAIRLQNNSK